jgi:hypothetical protein
LKFDSSPATRTLLADAAQRAGNTELAQDLNLKAGLREFS